ncbi:MAG: prohibitin family protein [Nitrososphaeraceae archaeon]|nr:prohibitin family protein [Nitrososphaeraceae archaeon]
MVEISTIIGLVFTIIMIAVIGLQIYRRRYGMRSPMGGGFGRRYSPDKVTPEGEPLESYSPMSFNTSVMKVIIPAIIAIIVVIVVLTSSVKIVDAGYRGILLHFGAVDTSGSLDEGLHFVVPFRDNVIQMEVRTQKVVVSATSASKDLQDVSTEVALNYHLRPDAAQLLYQQLGYEYANRVIQPAIQESVKQVTARFNAEELITKREIVKGQIEEQIKQRLGIYFIDVESLSITEFRFSQQFTKAVEAKVEAQQRALQAQNELLRIRIEANQTEAKAIGEQRAAIAQATGLRQANILKAQGEAEAIQIIDKQLRDNPTYLEWLKTQRWDGKLPLVTSGGGPGASGITPFIEIPTEQYGQSQRANSTSMSTAMPAG